MNINLFAIVLSLPTNPIKREYSFEFESFYDKICVKYLQSKEIMAALLDKTLPIFSNFGLFSHTEFTKCKIYNSFLLLHVYRNIKGQNLFKKD